MHPCRTQSACGSSNFDVCTAAGDRADAFQTQLLKAVLDSLIGPHSLFHGVYADVSAVFGSIRAMEVLTIAAATDLYDDLEHVRDRLTAEKAHNDLLRVQDRALEAEKLASKLKRDLTEHKVKVRLRCTFPCSLQQHAGSIANTSSRACSMTNCASAVRC
jgi:hypothetical protein